jgi:hypothetical protein
VSVGADEQPLFAFVGRFDNLSGGRLGSGAVELVKHRIALIGGLAF